MAEQQSLQSVAFLTAWSIYSLMVCPVRQNLIEAATPEGKNGWKVRRAAFSASPENSRTSTLCLLVVTVTGTEGEPGVGGEKEGKESG